ncbi:MAG: autotransporter domain-containing protein, partial [Planctomycetaceae bacterium]|nr:autotransporter domain-containing protein [Planctomycetaceae bacterium]
AGDGGYQAANGSVQAGGTGGGGFGAGGALFVEHGATVTIAYSSGTSNVYSNNTVTGGTGGGGSAGNGDAVGSDMFLTGNLVVDTGTTNNAITMNQNIGGLAGTTKFDITKTSDLQAYRSDLFFTGNGTVTLTGNNTYIGKTVIGDGINNVQVIASGTGSNAILSTANGSNTNAISDISEVEVKSGSQLSLNGNETIGYLSGTGTVNLFSATGGGRTLTIAGDEDPNFFGQGINPVTGLPVPAFTGEIKTDGNSGTVERLVKTGTGRLTLSGDNYAANSPDDQFQTTIYQGTIALGNHDGLGRGDVFVKNIDQGTGAQLRNVLEATANLTGTGNAVMNRFIISSGTGLALNNTTSTFGPMVVGGGNNIQFGEAGVQGGQITGGNLLINMDAIGNKVILANDGYDAASGTYKAANLNNYRETQISRGTVVVNSYNNAAGNNDTLGSGNVRVLTGVGDNSAALSAATNGMTIDNGITVESGSSLVLQNETAGIDYTLSGGIGGNGGIRLLLSDAGDTVTATGQISYSGPTNLERGTFQIAASATTGGRTLLNNLTGTSDGHLIVDSGDLFVAVNSDSTFAGDIALASGATLYKTGTATWELTGSGQIGSNILNVNSGALKLSSTDAVSNVALTGSGRLVVNANAVQLDSLTANSYSTNVTVLPGMALVASNTSGSTNKFYGTWSGDISAQVTFQGPDPWELHGNSTSVSNGWNGRFIINNTNLIVAAHGALGLPGTATVEITTGGTLTVNPNPAGQYQLVTEQIKELNVSGSGGTLNVVGTNVGTTMIGNALMVDTLSNSGAGKLTKTGGGALIVHGSQTGYTAGLNLESGTLWLQRYPNSATPPAWQYDSDWGTGTLNVTGNANLVVDVDDTTKTINQDIALTGGDLNIYVNTNGVAFPGTYDQSGDIGGSYGINKYGQGTLLYDTSKTYTGDTNVYEGILQVGAAMASADTFVHDGGALDLQSGAAFGGNNITVNNGGLLTGNSTGYDIGTLTLNSGSTIVGDYVTGTPTYDAANVVIQNGAKASILVGGSIDPTTFSETLISGAHSDGTLPWFMDNIAHWRAYGEWSGNDLIFKFAPVDYMDNVISANQSRFGQFLNVIADNHSNQTPVSAFSLYPVNDVLNQLFIDLENIADPNDYRYAYDELSGEIYGSLTVAQAQTTTNMFSKIIGQVRPEYNRYEPAGEASTTTYRGQSVCRDGWTGWTSALGIIGDTSNNAGMHGYDFSTFGMAIGIEPSAVLSQNRLGLFYAYNYTNIDTNKTIGKGHVADNFIGAYGRFVDVYGYTSFVGGFGIDKYKARRSVTMVNNGGAFNTSYDGWQGGFYVERGLPGLQRYRSYFQPFVGLQYLHLNHDEIDENGTSVARLFGDSGNMDSVRSNLGLRLTHDLAIRRGTMQLRGNLSWMHEFADANCGTAFALPNTGNPSQFLSVGNSLGRDWILAGAGLNWAIRQNLSLFGSYDLQFNKYQVLNVVNAGAQLSW